MKLLRKIGMSLVVAALVLTGVFSASPVSQPIYASAEVEETAENDIEHLNQSFRTLYTYTGKAVKLEISFEKDGQKLKKGTDYSLSYWKVRTKNGKTIRLKKLGGAPKAVGQYEAVAIGKGTYTGSYSLHFNIALKGTSIKSLKAGKKSLTITWKKQPVQTDGYVILIGCYGGAGNSLKWAERRNVTVKGKNKTSLTVKKLKTGWTYTVHVSTYKKVGGVPVSSGTRYKTVKIR